MRRGGAAGGLAAFIALLNAMAPKSGMAFVLIQHLEPQHESALATLLSKATTMPVVEVFDGIAAEPNHVYVIPPNKSMTIREGTLRLASRSKGLQYPIYEFSIALAKEQGNAAIGVVLSGTGSDGAHGLKAIKAAGGVTFAQDPKTAQWHAMPMSAIAAGSVDFVLSPKRIAAELARIAATSTLRRHEKYPREADWAGFLAANFRSSRSPGRTPFTEARTITFATPILTQMTGSIIKLDYPAPRCIRMILEAPSAAPCRSRSVDWSAGSDWWCHTMRWLARITAACCQQPRW